MIPSRKNPSQIRKKKKGKKGDTPSNLLKQKIHEREDSFIKPKKKKK